MKLDVESLRALRLVVETGGFTEAAARLGVTQSAVSWKIKRLEERVGLELVKRGQQVEATPDGRDLLVYADRILAAHDEAVAHLTRSDLEGVIRLGSNEDLHTTRLAELLARFNRAYPNVRVEVRVQLSGTVVEWLDDGEVDLAVVQILSEGPDGVRPDDTVLWTETLEWVRGPTVALDPGDEVPLVTFGPGWAFADEVEEALDRAGVLHRSVLECPTLEGVRAAVVAGLGVAVLNLRNCTPETVVWAEAPASLPEVSYVVRVGHDHRAVVEALRSELVAALGGGPGADDER